MVLKDTIASCGGAFELLDEKKMKKCEYCEVFNKYHMQYTHVDSWLVFVSLVCKSKTYNRDLPFAK